MFSHYKIRYEVIYININVSPQVTGLWSARGTGGLVSVAGQ